MTFLHITLNQGDLKYPLQVQCLNDSVWYTCPFCSIGPPLPPLGWTIDCVGLNQCHWVQNKVMILDLSVCSLVWVTSGQLQRLSPWRFWPTPYLQTKEYWVRPVHLAVEAWIEPLPLPMDVWFVTVSVPKEIWVMPFLCPNEIRFFFRPVPAQI